MANGIERSKIISWFVCLTILCLAGFFRLYLLSSVPPSASLDEASIGWNAYSLLETGKDEYGSLFPILLRAYDDYRPALYVYFVVPLVALFGLTAWVVRVPSVISSLGVVIFGYCIGREVFYKEKYRELGQTIDTQISNFHKNEFFNIRKDFLYAFEHQVSGFERESEKMGNNNFAINLK